MNHVQFDRVVTLLEVAQYGLVYLELQYGPRSDVIAAPGCRTEGGSLLSVCHHVHVLRWRQVTDGFRLSFRTLGYDRHNLGKDKMRAGERKNKGMRCVGTLI